MIIQMSPLLYSSFLAEFLYFSGSCKWFSPLVLILGRAHKQSLLLLLTFVYNSELGAWSISLLLPQALLSLSVRSLPYVNLVALAKELEDRGTQEKAARGKIELVISCSHYIHYKASLTRLCVLGRGI
jgi:hypothetical protein